MAVNIVIDIDQSPEDSPSLIKICLESQTKIAEKNKIKP